MPRVRGVVRVRPKLQRLARAWNDSSLLTKNAFIALEFLTGFCSVRYRSTPKLA
jgi:hypothetical protein